MTTLVSRLLALVITVWLMGHCLSSVAQSPETVNDNGTLRELNVRRMNDEDYKRRGQDVIGDGYTVRLRYEAPFDHGIFLFTLNEMDPQGYLLERKGTTIRWIVGVGGKDGSHSPGIKGLEQDTAGAGGWLYLSAHSAIEWEIFVWPTSPGTEFARSVFVREGNSGHPVEVISPWLATDGAK
jgi:hypothetical protein